MQNVTNIGSNYLTDDEKEIQETRKILGKYAEGMTDEDIKHQITCIDYLVQTWIDEYERTIFDGKTLKEAIQYLGSYLHIETLTDLSSWEKAFVKNDILIANS